MKNKLELKKKTVAVLSDSDLKMVEGGEEAQLTTSFNSCTGFLCCNDTSLVYAFLRATTIF